MRNPYFIICCVFLLFSCKENKKETHQLPTVEPLSVIQLFDNPSEEKSQLPRLFSNGNALYFSWVTRKDSTDHLHFSVLKDSTWTLPSEITSGKDWFTNWADFPAIAENKGTVLTNILQKSANGTYTYDIKLNLYDETLKQIQGEQDFFLHDDGTKSEHGFVSMQPYNDGLFQVAWLDGRNTSAAHDSETHESAGAMTLRTAQVSYNGTIANRVELDNRVCDCCNTAMAITNKGPVVVYRDRSDDDIRDISITRLIDSIWTKPETIHKDNWKIAGCPVNGPAVDALDDHLAVAWFTAKNDKPKVHVIFSEDNGETFDIPIRVDTNESLGRVDLVMLSKESAAIVWMELLEDETLIQLIKVNSNGSRGEVMTVSKTDSSRASGFPQLEKVGDTLFLAWAMLKEGGSSIKTAKVAIAQL
ncbi:hypothetical protein ACFQO1_10750 [Jejudonia soesokkakensis]|uniref:BNR repeat protein n=1 Tax=Jejudonia soesokkakensis TaxID=1323432 RepID=A0ABW2MX66_9FLAO